MPDTAQFILNRLTQWGIKRIYGYPGDGIARRRQGVAVARTGEPMLGRRRAPARSQLVRGGTRSGAKLPHGCGERLQQLVDRGAQQPVPAAKKPPTRPVENELDPTR